MAVTRRVVPFNKPNSVTRSRIHKVGGGTTAPSKKLDKEAAEKLIGKIKGDLREIEGDLIRLRDLVYRFYVGKGWKALGYKSLRECFQDRLSSYSSESYLYRETRAAKVEHNLGKGKLLPMGKTVPERVLRPLSAFKDPEQQRKVWKRACKQSGKEPGKEIPTSSAIEKEVAKLSSKSSPKPKAKRTGTAKLREKAKKNMEALGERIVAKHGRLFVMELIEWLGKHLPPRKDKS